MGVTGQPRVKTSAWKWSVCGLLLLASAINYMDRQTLSNAAVRITTQFDLRQEQYGNMELVFGWAFAIWGSALYWWAGVVYVIQVRSLSPMEVAVPEPGHTVGS